MDDKKKEQSEYSIFYNFHDKKKQQMYSYSLDNYNGSS